MFNLSTLGTGQMLNHIDPEALAEILEAMKSAAARLKGQPCEFSNKRAAAALDRARLDLIELTQQEPTK